eukprot:3495861-Prymnesium_polylepis.1
MFRAASGPSSRQGRKACKTPRRGSNTGFELRDLGYSPMSYSDGAILNGWQRALYIPPSV